MAGEQTVTVDDVQEAAQALAGTRELVLLLLAVVAVVEERVRALEQEP